MSITFHDPGISAQKPCDVAVVMTTVCRPTLRRAVESVYRQEGAGRIHLLIGVDRPLYDQQVIDAALASRPPHCVVTVLDLGFSTSESHGGQFAGRSGGALRSILSLAANSNHLAYLDDDNWFAPDHLASLRAAVAGHDWAWSLRWFVDADSGKIIGLDHFESVGPGRGLFNERFGGWCDPNTLLIDRTRCSGALIRWSHQLVLADGTAASADRCVFDLLRSRRGRGTGAPSCYYETRSSDINHAFRLQMLAQNHGPFATQLPEAAVPVRNYSPGSRVNLSSP